jgi:hypothetical protein
MPFDWYGKMLDDKCLCDIICRQNFFCQITNVYVETEQQRLAWTERDLDRHENDDCRSMCRLSSHRCFFFEFDHEFIVHVSHKKITRPLPPNNRWDTGDSSNTSLHERVCEVVVKSVGDGRHAQTGLCHIID